MNKTLAGGLAGCLATIPMTAAMEAMYRQLPPEEQYPLPPRTITMNMADEVVDRREVEEAGKLEATLFAHFAQGTLSGLVYAQVADRLPGPPVARGVGFGLALWAGSYLGVLPALGLISSASHHPARRNTLMIAAHVVWGAGAGILLNRLAEGSRDRR